MGSLLPARSLARFLTNNVISLNALARTRPPPQRASSTHGDGPLGIGVNWAGPIDLLHIRVFFGILPYEADQVYAALPDGGRCQAVF